MNYGAAVAAIAYDCSGVYVETDFQEAKAACVG